MTTMRILTAAAVVLTLALPAAAQPQSKAQQKCLTSVAKKALKISSTAIKEGSKCVTKAAKGSLGTTAAACIADSDSKKRAKARTKLDDAVAKSCGTSPDFGFIDAATASVIHEDEGEATFVDGFGSDVDATLAASAGVDPGAKCGKNLHKGIRKLSDGMQKEWGKCLKDGLKDESIIDSSGLLACLDVIKTDVKGKIGKQATKLGAKFSAQCFAKSATQCVTDFSA